MATTAKRKPKEKSEDQILDEATVRLMQAIKGRQAAAGKPISADQMRKEGYSERYIAKFEGA